MTAMKYATLLFVLLSIACGDDDTPSDGGSVVDAPHTDVAVEDTGPGDTVTADVSAPSGRVNIRDAVFDERSGDCAAYAVSSIAEALDIQNDMGFEGLVDIEVGEEACTLSSNAIPNHDFNDASARFATNVGEIATSWEIPRNPTPAASPTELGLQTYDGVMLNGVVLDLLAAGCFGVGDERSGCNDIGTPYRFDPMSEATGFGTDMHNAHTQPDGRYHYHGDPLAMYGEPEDGASGVIGFAADGYPIYGPYFDDGTVVRAARSSYVLRSGERDGGPGGTFDGTFVDDFLYDGSGDLDECNGMTVDGQYGYYVTNGYPWVLACFRGPPDASFNKRR